MPPGATLKYFENRVPEPISIPYIHELMGNTLRKTFLVTFASILIVAGAAVIFSVPERASAYTPHSPIRIASNADFIPANGVTGGSGTAADPYIIEGWDIDASSAQYGIFVAATDAHFVIRNVYVHSGLPDKQGIYIYGVTNARVENATVDNNYRGMQVLATNVAIMDSNITGSLEKGILLYGTNAVLAGNSVTDNAEGGLMVQGDNIVLSANRVSRNGITGTSNYRDGVDLYAADHVTISGNTFSDNAVYGLKVERSTNVTVKGNTFTSDGMFLEGYELSHFNSQTITTDNLVNGEPLRYYKDCGGLDVDGIPVGQLIVANCTDVRVANVQINDTDVGIQIAFSDDMLIADARISASLHGIFLRDGANATLGLNNVSRSQCGICLSGMTRSVIARNNVSGNYEGIATWGANQLTIARNVVSRNGIGINLHQPATINFTVSDNLVSFNSLTGVYVMSLNSSSGNSYIVRNTILENGRGVALFMVRGGIAIDHNNFVNNTVQATDDGGPANRWDGGCPSGGNFWSDYMGVDAVDCETGLPGSDGIGDSPYVIDADSQDRYPLMSQVPTGLPNTPPSVSVVAPVGNTDWTGGSLHSIVWRMNDSEDAVLNVTVNVSSDGGATWRTVASGPYAGGAIEIPWPVPVTDTNRTWLRVCVADSDGLRTCDESTGWTIDSTSPQVLMMLPSDGASEVSTTEDFMIAFNESVDQASAVAAFSLDPAASGLIFRWSGTGQQPVLAISHDPLRARTNYTMAVSMTLRDDSQPGNHLSAAWTLGFSTGAVPIAQPPLASAVVKNQVEVGELVTFDGSRSTGNITSYTWTIADSEGKTIDVLYGMTVTYAFKGAGRYRVTLKVIDASSGLNDEDALEVAVTSSSNAWPIALLISVLALALAMIAGTELGRVPILTVLLAALNGRKYEEKEDTPGRFMVLGYIIGNPGDNYTDIKNNLKMNNGPLSWHLMKLEKEGLVKSRVEGTRKCYYPAGMTLSVENGGELHAVQRRLLKAVETDPGKPVGVLAEELGVSRQLALYHLRKLSQKRMLTLERRGLRLKVYPAGSTIHRHREGHFPPARVFHRRMDRR